MIVRSIDTLGDWSFGKGKNDYKKDLDAITQNIKTRLNSFLGDCFFDLSAGVDWFSLMGSKDQKYLELVISSIILNTQDVTGLLFLSITIDVKRKVTAQYKVQTTLGSSDDFFIFDVNGIA